MEKDNKNNVVIFPQIINKGKSELLFDGEMTADEGIKALIEKITELSTTSDAIFALTLDAETGTPTLIMGGSVDIPEVNIFLDLLKEQMIAAFLAESYDRQ